MQYVGKVLNTVTEFYKEINPSTLSGAIDIVVTEQPDGELACSPFHVRFGKLQLLRPQDKKVEVSVNGKVISFPMKVGDAGEAFFVFETEDPVPEEYSTSPLVEAVEGDEEPEFLDIGPSTEPATEDNDTGYVSAHSGHGSDFGEDEKPSNLAHDSPVKASAPLNHTAISSPGSLLFGNGKPIKGQIHSITSSNRMEKFGNIAVMKIQQDSEMNLMAHTIKTLIEGKLDESDHPILKNEGHDHIILDTAGYKAEDMKNIQEALYSMPSFEQLMKEADEMEQAGEIPDREVQSEQPKAERINSGDNPEDIEIRAMNDSQPFRSVEEIDRDREVEERDDPLVKRERELDQQLGHQNEKSLSSSALAHSNQKEYNPESHGPFSDTELDCPVHTNKSSRRDSVRQTPLSDTELDYEFTESSGVNASNEWSWGWEDHRISEKIATDNVDEVKKNDASEEQTGIEIEGNRYTIEMSLCGGYEDFGRDETENLVLFQDHMIGFEEFSENPSIVIDPKMVFRYENRYYTWPAIAPLFISLVVYHKPLSEEVFRKHLETVPGFVSPKMSAAKHTLGSSASVKRRYSFAGSIRNWWSRSSPEPLSDDEDMKATVPEKANTYSGPDPVSRVDSEVAPPQKRYAKTLRLTSEQLKSLNLVNGVNTITFSVSTGPQSRASCSSRVFFWKYDTKIVISDIDGTITKSDALGHLFTMVGKDWTHNGVAKLYTDISKNGFQFLYLTSRAIGQADTTRDYLRKVEQGPYQLPEGPVIMSPDRLFTSLHREVIMRQPQIFKMACLRDIKQLFGDHNPFYAGFGNRITDALSYRSVDVPVSRIFTIEYSGDLKLELLAGYRSSYIKLNDLVDQIFPPQTTALEAEYNDWNYWKSDLPDIDFPELDEPASPVSEPLKPENKRLGMLRSLTRIASRSTLSLYSNKSDEEEGMEGTDLDHDEDEEADNEEEPELETDLTPTEETSENEDVADDMVASIDFNEYPY